MSLQVPLVRHFIRWRTSPSPCSERQVIHVVASRKRLGSALAASGAAVLAVSTVGFLPASAAPTAATGSFDQASSAVVGVTSSDQSVFFAGYGISLGATRAVSGELFAFCIQPSTDFDIGTTHSLIAAAQSAKNATVGAIAPKDYDAIRYLLEHVTYYAPDAAAVAAGYPDFTDTPLGTSMDKNDPAGIIGTATSADLDIDGDGTAGEYEGDGNSSSDTPNVEDVDGDGRFDENEPRAIDVEYAAFAAAVRKLIDPTTDFTTTGPTEIQDRAQALYDAATLDADSDGTYDNAPTLTAAPYAAEISATLNESPTADTASLAITVSGLSGADGSTVALANREVTITTEAADVDVDPAVEGVQNTVTLSTNEAGDVVDSAGAVAHIVGRGAAEATLTVRVEQGIAPGTIINTVDAAGAVDATVQQLITAGWAAVETTVSLPAAGTEITTTTTTAPATTDVPPATTTPGTELPFSGPETTLPLLFLGAGVGAVGLWLRRRTA